jgi:hypothetical protein
MPDALIGVPFLSLVAVCLALVRIGCASGRGRFWVLAALAAAVPPLAFVVLVELVRPGGMLEPVMMPLLLSSVWLSAPVAAVMIWVVAVSR